MTAQPTTVHVDDLLTLPGTDLGVSTWREVTQDDVDLFAKVTGDHQWIHVDPVRAADGPFGGTIAHGHLTLSLIPVLLAEILVVEGASLGINYGMNRVRFPAPLRVGARVRAQAALTEAEPVPGGVQAVATVTVTAEDAPRPVCVAEIVFRYLR
ncbi:MaoC family dehydratase [Actinocorallia sp. A-T 12471]|uniref:MaoC family dehydratase n=1 Tax=Actinocorallia sp. A-T 12471 TaxID=3089813 RepID=UPI0029D0A67E|nr:MaoC family dehydratase [Actinocorallia sp. A-T 12471]MDX6739456.1 MaoC family dehydratase [Actinocorallia sp. A-T 12471]